MEKVYERCCGIYATWLDQHQPVHRPDIVPTASLTAGFTADIQSIAFDLAIAPVVFDLRHVELLSHNDKERPPGNAGWPVGRLSGGLVVQPARHVIELIVDISDALKNIGAEMVDHLLVLCFTPCVFLEHAEKPRSRLRD